MFSLLFPLLSSFAFPWSTLIISITDLLSWFIYNIKQTLGELFHRVQLVHIWVVKLMEISSQEPIYVVAFSFWGGNILLILFSREDRILISLSTFLSSILIILFRKRIVVRQLIAAGKRPWWKKWDHSLISLTLFIQLTQLNLVEIARSFLCFNIKLLKVLFLLYHQLMSHFLKSSFLTLSGWKIAVFNKVIIYLDTFFFGEFNYQTTLGLLARY